MLRRTLYSQEMDDITLAYDLRPADGEGKYYVVIKEQTVYHQWSPFRALHSGAQDLRENFLLWSIQVLLSYLPEGIGVGSINLAEEGEEVSLEITQVRNRDYGSRGKILDALEGPLCK